MLHFFKKLTSSSFLNHQRTSYSYSITKKETDAVQQAKSSPFAFTNSSSPNLSKEEDFENVYEMNQQVDEINKEFDNFIKEKVRKEGRDAKELIIDNAYEISNQLKEYGFFSTKFVNLDYVDLRYFREEKEGLYPLNMYITKYYADNYLLSERYYKNHAQKKNQLNELQDQVICEFKRLIIQCLIEEEEDIEIIGRGEDQKIYKKKIIACLNPKISMKDNKRMLTQRIDFDSCPKFFDCIVLNEEEKQIFLLTFEKKFLISIIGIQTNIVMNQLRNMRQWLIKKGLNYSNLFPTQTPTLKMMTIYLKIYRILWVSTTFF